MIWIQTAEETNMMQLIVLVDKSFACRGLHATGRDCQLFQTNDVEKVSTWDLFQAQERSLQLLLMGDYTEQSLMKYPKHFNDR